MAGRKIDRRKKRLFLLRRCSQESQRQAVRFLRELGIKVLTVHQSAAIVGSATEEQLESARESAHFSAVYSKNIKKEHLDKIHDLQKEVVQSWNYARSRAYRPIQKDLTDIGTSWSDKSKEAPGPATICDPEEYKKLVEKHLDITEEQLLKKARRGKRPKRLSGEDFKRLERKLRKIHKDETLAYHLVRLAWFLPAEYHSTLESLPTAVLADFFQASVPDEDHCWKMENEISVGVVFVESSRSGGPKFSSKERNTLQARIWDGLEWLSEQAPSAAKLTWVFDWQFVKIDVANGNDDSEEDYWRNPAMGLVNYNGNTYTASWSGVADYREDMREANLSSHAAVIFVTPYANEHFGYANQALGRITLARCDDWGNWGIKSVDKITSHEMCHLFHAADEYTGSTGTPCSICTTLHGCLDIPHGNCGACAKPFQDCIMDQNYPRLCAYTQGHIGWSDLFVELTTPDEKWAGTNDDVWLDIGDRTFYLDTLDHDDRERGNIEGYALNYTGVDKADIKRVGIRKSPDGSYGGWKLKRVRLWCKGELICDADNINRWLEDHQRWWVCSTCGSSSEIINTLAVKITTADVKGAGTDDDVKIYFGGRGWDLDNPWRDDFERGHTDTFYLDPGTGLYKNMLSSIRVNKSPDGSYGGWKLKGVQIIVNGVSMYDKQNINKWLEDDDRDWFGSF